ncbi:MAG TPA: tetratricopeptide repeat protein [Kiritimatiellia bacterium]|nr:tetratricopeptide repeat protein [Kiritimatiellia bacterium]HRU69637.1 tetratricopeptide repeat protein [Kiritimatiellia bacterium]
MKVFRVDPASWRTAVCVAACLMIGVLPVVELHAMDAVAGRTLHTGLMFWLCTGVGLALGYVAVALVCRRGRLHGGAVLMSLLLLALAASVIAQGMYAPRLVAAWQGVLNALTRHETQYLSLLLRTGLLFAALPALAAGAVVRAALQSFRQDATDARPGATFTLGVLLILFPAGIGMGLGSSVLFPWMGFGLLRTVALWCGVLAGLVLARGVWSILPILAVGLALCLNGPTDWDAALSAGVFSRLVHRDSGFAYGKPVFTHQTRHHTVAAYEDADYGFVYVQDGRPLLFGNRFHTARTLTAYVPLLLRPSCERAALFGPDAGLYLPFLARAGVKDLAVGGCDADLLKLTIAADEHLTGTPLDLTRVSRRRARLTGHQAYDLIVLAGEPMWMRGTRRAYGAGLFARCKAALAPGGLVALHVDGRALALRRFAAVTRDFVRVFPHMQLWCVGEYDWLLVGSDDLIQSPADQMLACFERPPVMRDFARAGVLALPEALAGMVCDGAGAAPWLERAGFESVRANAWRVPKVAFGTGIWEGLLTPHALEPVRQKTLEWLLPGETDVGVYQAIRERTLACADARTLAARALAQTAAGQGEAGLADARAAAKLNARDPLLTRLAESLELEGRRRIAIGEFKGGLKCYENLLSFSPGSAYAHYGMGFCLRASGEPETAYLHFARAVATAPEQIGFRMELAQVAASIGEYAEADRQYEEILRREPDHAEALYRYAACLSAQARADKDMARALTLAEKACHVTAWQNLEYAYGLANLYLDAGRVMEGMGLKRRLKEQGRP